MKKKYAKVSDKVIIVGRQRGDGYGQVVDYYLEHPKWGREYAFTRRYTKGTYNLVKGGIPVKQLLQVRSKDRMVMKLVAYTGLMMAYFMDEINWLAG